MNLGAFDDAEVIHVEGDVDPIRDMEIIRDELRYAINLSRFPLRTRALIVRESDGTD